MTLFRCWQNLYSVYSPGLGPCLGWRVPWARFKDLWSPAWVSCSSFDGFSFSVPMFIIGVFSGRVTNYESLVLATSEFPEKHLIIQSINTVTNIKSTPNTQEMLSNTLS